VRDDAFFLANCPTAGARGIFARRNSGDFEASGGVATRDGSDRTSHLAGRLGSGRSRRRHLGSRLRARRAEFRTKRQPNQRRSWGKGLGWVLAGLFTLPIWIFVLGVVGFTFGITLKVLTSVGLALLAAGLGLLLSMSFAWFGILVGVLAGLMKLFKGK